MIANKFLFSQLMQTAFRTKAMECHPDQNQDNKGLLLTQSLVPTHLSSLSTA
jgi:hypothetical protein